jgi:hypothetical protein
MLEFPLDVFPFLGVVRRLLHRRDHRPLLREALVDLQELLLIGWKFILGVNGIHRAFRFAERAVDALLGVDRQEVRPLVEAVDRANLDAIRVFATNAALGHHVRHGRASVYNRG